MLTPEGEWTLFVPLPDDMGERMRRLRLVHGFMAWKSATAFVLFHGVAVAGLRALCGCCSQEGSHRGEADHTEAARRWRGRVVAGECYWR